MIKKCFVVIVIALMLLSCVGTAPYKFAVLWDSRRISEFNERINSDFWIRTDFVKTSKDTQGKKIVIIPKFTSFKYIDRGLTKREVNSSIETYSIIQIEILKISPLKTEKYLKYSKKLKKGMKLYLSVKGAKHVAIREFKKIALEYNPVKMYSINEDELDRIARKKIGVGDREVLLFLAYGDPFKVYRETVKKVFYRKYYYKDLAYFFVSNGIIRIKTDTVTRYF